MVALICSDPGVTVKADLQCTVAMIIIIIEQTHMEFLAKVRISLCFKAMFQSLFGNAGRTTHVLIRTVGATANKSWREVRGEVVYVLIKL